MWKHHGALWPLPEHGFTDERHSESSTPSVLLDRILIHQLFMARLDNPYVPEIKLATWFRFREYQVKVHVGAARHPFRKAVSKLFNCIVVLVLDITK